MTSRLKTKEESNPLSQSISSYTSGGNRGLPRLAKRGSASHINRPLYRMKRCLSPRKKPSSQAQTPCKVPDRRLWVSDLASTPYLGGARYARARASRAASFHAGRSICHGKERKHPRGRWIERNMIDTMICMFPVTVKLSSLCAWVERWSRIQSVAFLVLRAIFVTCHRSPTPMVSVYSRTVE
jgi:hypothetical protein